MHCDVLWSLRLLSICSILFPLTLGAQSLLMESDGDRRRRIGALWTEFQPAPVDRDLYGLRERGMLHSVDMGECVGACSTSGSWREGAAELIQYTSNPDVLYALDNSRKGFRGAKRRRRE